VSIIELFSRYVNEFPRFSRMPKPAGQSMREEFTDVISPMGYAGPKTKKGSWEETEF
jgi:hypothetical protein